MCNLAVRYQYASRQWYKLWSIKQFFPPEAFREAKTKRKIEVVKIIATKKVYQQRLKIMTFPTSWSTSLSDPIAFPSLCLIVSIILFAIPLCLTNTQKKETDKSHPAFDYWFAFFCSLHSLKTLPLRKIAAAERYRYWELAELQLRWRLQSLQSVLP